VPADYDSTQAVLIMSKTHQESDEILRWLECYHQFNRRVEAVEVDDEFYVTIDLGAGRETKPYKGRSLREAYLAAMKEHPTHL
jgi:hypothetical protein